ncbi:hypothetical protein [Stratiformator vulcanicus]|uniref:Uncharacterized protein n=1 Tax=Stratiformator vulcanicus TaxID=2527980 RepID=A0A517QZA3_9PLAN|nr:hypothetical protein [Stratiformator vulcanicus]QDT36975.1 hypothetical protein Pan189_13390 [Stratiformator vulcanicus]
MRSQIFPDDASAAELADAMEPIEFVDAEGNVLGLFRSEKLLKALEYAEERHRTRPLATGDYDGRGKTTAEVLDDLRKKFP